MIQKDYKNGFKILEKNYPNELKHYAVLEILKNAQLKELEKLSSLFTVGIHTFS